MEKGPGVVEALSSPAGGGTAVRLDARLRSLSLLQRSGVVRKLVDVGTRGVHVEPVPPCLGESQRALLVSNYPGVSETLRALIKMGCRLPGDGYRLKGIGRPDVVRQANNVLKALGIDDLIFPVYKDDAGAYRLHKRVIKEVLDYLDGQGNVLWMSITGTTRGNGLLEGDLRTGAAVFSVSKGVPLVPMALVTKEVRGRPNVVKVRFGEPVQPPPVAELDDFDRNDLLIDLSRLVLCGVASLLPPGQRGDFEEPEEKLEEAQARLSYLCQ
jgi:hypothetical protein